MTTLLFGHDKTDMLVPGGPAIDRIQSQHAQPATTLAAGRSCRMFPADFPDGVEKTHFWDTQLTGHNSEIADTVCLPVERRHLKYRLSP